VSPLFVFAMLGGLQLALALAGWVLAFAMSLSPSFRPYRGRMLGSVAGGSPGALIGAMVGYLGLVVIGAGCGTMISAERCASILGVATPFLLLIGYASGAAIGGSIGWRLGNDQRPA